MVPSCVIGFNILTSASCTIFSDETGSEYIKSDNTLGTIHKLLHTATPLLCTCIFVHSIVFKSVYRKFFRYFPVVLNHKAGGLRFIHSLTVSVAIFCISNTIYDRVFMLVVIILCGCHYLSSEYLWIAGAILVCSCHLYM